MSRSVHAGASEGAFWYMVGELSHTRMRLLAVLALVTTVVCSAADRQWQTGTWIDVTVKRQMVDFGPGASPFDRGRPRPSMRAMADVRLYVIETAALRLELKDVAPVNKRGFDAVVGQPVTFALDKSTIYVRDGDGIEHKLRVTKKTVRSRP